jgi:hypothetical protein
MVKLPWPTTDDALLALAWSWVDVLAKGDYATVFLEIGYARAFGGGAEAIRREIEEYRDPVYFSGETVFRVTDWRTAKGGNAAPTVRVERFVPTDTLPILAGVDVDLPLNGRWSRLRASFVAFVDGTDQDKAVFWLEDFWSPQDQDPSTARIRAQPHRNDG